MKILPVEEYVQQDVIGRELEFHVFDDILIEDHPMLFVLYNDLCSNYNVDK